MIVWRSAEVHDKKALLTETGRIRYRRRTKSRKAWTSPSRAGRKLLCRSNTMRKQVRALSSLSLASVSVAILSSSDVYGRRSSLFGKRFKISSTTRRKRFSIESIGRCALSRINNNSLNAGNKYRKNLSYSAVCTIS